MGSAEFKKIQGDIDALEGGFIKAKQAQQGFLQNLSELPGIAGTVGQSLKGVKGAMDLLASNPLVAVFSALAIVVIKVIDKLKSMEAVADALDKAFTVFGTVINALMDKAITPLINGVVILIDGFTGLIGKLASFVGISNSASTAASRYAEQLDRVSDAQGQLQIETAKANAKIAEARERANDATLSTRERTNALKEAAFEENRVAGVTKEAATQTAQAKLGLLAIEMNASAQTQALIRRGTKESLEAASVQLGSAKNLNREKLTDAQKYVADVYNIDAESSLRQRRLASSIRSLENEERQKSIEKAKQEAEQKRDFQKRLSDFQNDTRLTSIKDEQEKARVSLQIDKEKTIAEINSLEMKENRKNQLRLAAIEDFNAKEKVLLEKQAEENKKKEEEKLRAEQDFTAKVKDIQTAAIEDEVKRQKQARQDKFANDVLALQRDKEFIKKSKEEQNEIIKNLEKALNLDLEKIDRDAALKRLDDQLKILDYRSRALQAGTRAYFKVQEEIINTAYEREKLAAKGQADLLLSIEEKYQADKKALKQQEIKAYGEIASATINSFAAITSALAAGYDQEAKTSKAAFEQRKKLQLATAYLSAAAGIIQILTQPSVLPSPFDWIVKGANALALGITTAIQINTIKNTQFEGAAGGAGAGGGQNLGKNYADGGLLEGPRHKDGGIPIVAEGGEAVMTRGAVTMFGPLLSKLNQAGGGASFNLPAMQGAINDNPKSNTSNEQMIIKTYVVESDLTTQQNKQARLKDLSTL